MMPYGLFNDRLRGQWVTTQRGQMLMYRVTSPLWDDLFRSVVANDP